MGINIPPCAKAIQSVGIKVHEDLASREQKDLPQSSKRSFGKAERIYKRESWHQDAPDFSRSIDISSLRSENFLLCHRIVTFLDDELAVIDWLSKASKCAYLAGSLSLKIKTNSHFDAITLCAKIATQNIVFGSSLRF
jgi:hypothetical protein